MACEVGKKSEAMVEVKPISKTHVKPSKKIGKKECQLVTFDLPYLAFYYNQKLLFYKGGEFEDMVGKLKEGLGVVLEEYYQLAGRLGRYEDGVFKVEYDDEMDGVEVSEAVADAIGIQDLTAEDCTPPFKVLLPYNGILNIEGLHRPLLAVQLTKLRDGLAIGCAFNHAILDGSSTWHFMSAWAHACSGCKAAPPPPPFLDRTKARSTRMKLDLPDPSAAALSTNGTAEAAAAPLRVKLFRFSERAVDRIKSKVNAKSAANGGKPFSTFQALSSHVWRAVTRARELKPEEVTTYTVFADCRRRVDPPMPETYFGNLIQAVFTGAAAGQVTAYPAEFAAAKIQEAIVAHDSKAIDGRNDAWEKNPVIFQWKDAGLNCVAVGSSPRFRVYEVDFGWGPPEGVRSGGNNRFDGMVYLYQGKGGGRSIDVELSLEEGAMGRLERDAEFLVKVEDDGAADNGGA